MRRLHRGRKPLAFARKNTRPGYFGALLAAVEKPLHSEADAEEWNFLFTRIRDRVNHTRDSALAEPARNENAVHVAQTLLGRHDFTSFRAAACQAKSPLRTLDRLDVTRDGDMITVTVQARSFLHHQVRNMVGTLRLVGDGRWPENRVAAALAARDRAAAGPTAPAEGLTLVAVAYPQDPFAGADDQATSSPAPAA